MAVDLALQPGAQAFFAAQRGGASAASRWAAASAASAWAISAGNRRRGLGQARPLQLHRLQLYEVFYRGCIRDKQFTA